MTPEDRGIWLHLLTQSDRSKRRAAECAFDNEFKKGVTRYGSEEETGTTEGVPVCRNEGGSDSSEQGEAGGEAATPAAEVAGP